MRFAFCKSPTRRKLAILDWLMPGMDGVQICREIRQPTHRALHVHFAANRQETRKCDVIEGLDAGADDYVIKPFDSQELQVRLRTGKRILYLQEQLIAARESLARASHARFANRLVESGRGDWNCWPTNWPASSDTAVRSASFWSIWIDSNRNQRQTRTFGRRSSSSRCRLEAMQSAPAGTMPSAASAAKNLYLILPGCDLMNALSHAERLRAAIEQVASARRKVRVG